MDLGGRVLVSDTPTLGVLSDRRNKECKGFQGSVVPLLAEHFCKEWTRRMKTYRPFLHSERYFKDLTSTNCCAVLSVFLVLAALVGNTAS